LPFAVVQHVMWVCQRQLIVVYPKMQVEVLTAIITTVTLMFNQASFLELQQIGHVPKRELKGAPAAGSTGWMTFLSPNQ